MKRFEIIIHGQVQGIGFRVAAAREAKELGLVGFVENREDETVFIDAAGTAHALEKYITWCKVGPSGAAVTDVQITEASLPSPYPSFTIRS